jgi:hypothetical protein
MDAAGQFTFIFTFPAAVPLGKKKAKHTRNG